MKLSQLLSKVRKAIDDYHMIQEGDMVAVGVSGGKDSMTLLYALKELSRFYPCKFHITALCVDLGFGNMDFASMERYCIGLDIPLHVIQTQIAQIVFGERKEERPCALCSNLRKGAFNQAAVRLGCNKIAYAHHRDDVIETVLMSMFFEGRLHSFSPVTKLDRSGLTLIRPLLYLPEADIKGFVNKYQVPVLKNACPADGATNRQYMKELLNTVNRDLPGVKDRMFAAIKKDLLK